MKRSERSACFVRQTCFWLESYGTLTNVWIVRNILGVISIFLCYRSGFFKIGARRFSLLLIAILSDQKFSNFGLSLEMPHSWGSCLKELSWMHRKDSLASILKESKRFFFFEFCFPQNCSLTFVNYNNSSYRLIIIQYIRGCILYKVRLQKFNWNFLFTWTAITIISFRSTKNQHLIIGFKNDESIIPTDNMKCARKVIQV